MLYGGAEEAPGGRKAGMGGKKVSLASAEFSSGKITLHVDGDLSVRGGSRRPSRLLYAPHQMDADHPGGHLTSRARVQVFSRHCRSQKMLSLGLTVPAN